MALCIAPLLHTDMVLETRCETGLTGFLAVELFRMLAEQKTHEMKLPKGSGFMANQTVTNLVACALSAVVLCITKDRSFSPWRWGNARLSELPIEQWFSHLRSQSPNSQLSTRAFFQASARMSLRVNKDLNKEKAASHDGGEPALSEAVSPDLRMGPLLFSSVLGPLLFSSVLEGVHISSLIL